TWGFSRNELVSFAGLRVLPGNRKLQIRMQQKIGDVSLHLEQLTHHKPPILMERAYWNMELIAALVPEIPGVHVSIVELTDQTGRSIGPGISHALEKHGRSFLFHTAPGSETLNITFAVQRSQIVEF